METITATQAGPKLYALIDSVFESHAPCVIKGDKHNAVLVSEEDWRSVQETLYLLSVPGMRESIREGLDTPLSETTPKLDW